MTSDGVRQGAHADTVSIAGAGPHQGRVAQAIEESDGGSPHQTEFIEKVRGVPLVRLECCAY
jgi:hypothetical protein